jgi:hypothetical protein
VVEEVYILFLLASQLHLNEQLGH